MRMSYPEYQRKVGNIVFPLDVVRYLMTLRNTDEDVQHLAYHMVDRATVAYPAINEQLKNYFEPKSILDIGCGLALIDVLYAQHHPITRVSLIDGDGKAERIPDKYSPDQRPWNSVWLGAEMVHVNCPKAAVDARMPDQISNEFANQVDLIVSIRSWGHHYPVDPYLELVKRVLSPQGVIVTDIRANTNGRQLIEQAGFSTMCRIRDSSTKCDRLAFTRKA